MKCEFCGNDKIWKGSLRDGCLICEHCASGKLNVHMTDGSVVCVPNGAVIVTVGGGGAGGCSASQGAICVGAGGSGVGGSGVGSGPDGEMNYMDYDI